MPNENLGVWGRAPIRATKLELNHLNLFLGQYFFAFDFESKLLTFNIASDALPSSEELVAKCSCSII